MSNKLICVNQDLDLILSHVSLYWPTLSSSVRYLHMTSVLFDIRNLNSYKQNGFNCHNGTFYSVDWITLVASAVVHQTDDVVLPSQTDDVVLKCWFPARIYQELSIPILKSYTTTLNLNVKEYHIISRDVCIWNVRVSKLRPRNLLPFFF